MCIVRLLIAWAIAVAALIIGLPATAWGQPAEARFVFPSANSQTANSESSHAASPAVVAQNELFADAADGRLDRLGLLEAALIAGETFDPQRRAAYRRQFEHAVAELQTSGRVVGTTLDRARAIHEFMHARFLRGGFGEASTTLDAVFDDGRFNCISSLILFRCLADRFQLRCRSVEVPGHVYAVVETEAGPLVVQTTCPTWFTVLGDDALRTAALQRTLGTGAASADGGAADGRTLDDLGLTAVVFYNRGLDHLEAGRFERSFAANRAALQLDARNTAAHANLLATLNNWSLERYRTGHAAEAVRLLEQGLAIDPNYALFRENLGAVRGQTSR